MRLPRCRAQGPELCAECHREHEADSGNRRMPLFHRKIRDVHKSVCQGQQGPAPHNTRQDSRDTGRADDGDVPGLAR